MLFPVCHYNKSLVQLTLISMAVCLTLAAAAYALRLMTLPGAITGLVLASLLWNYAGFRGFLLLAAFFVLGSGATRIAKRRAPPRVAAQAAANAGAALIFAILGWTPAVVAALAEAAADTVASEIGPLLRGRVFLITNGREVPAGTSGGVSVAGTLAGLAAAAVVTTLAVATGMVRPGWSPGIILAAGTGSLVDSFLGATLEKRGWINNDGVNLLGTLAAGLLVMDLLS